MTLSRMIKRNARLALKGNRGRGAAVVFVLAALVLTLAAFQQYATDILIGVPGSSGALPLDILNLAGGTETALLAFFALLSVLLVIPAEIGAMRWFYLLIQGASPPLTEVFDFFGGVRKFIKAIGLYINICVRMLLWAALFYISPSAMLWVSILTVNGVIIPFESGSRLNPVFGTVGVMLSISLFFLVTILYASYMNRYSLAAYAYFEDEEISVISAISESVKLTRGYRFSLLWFELSFTGWLLASILVVPVFYAAPYFCAAFTIYARYITEKKRGPYTGAVNEPLPESQFSAENPASSPTREFSSRDIALAGETTLDAGDVSEDLLGK